MNEENAQVIYDLLDRIKVTDENRERMEKIRKFLSESKFQEAFRWITNIANVWECRIWGLCRGQGKGKKDKREKTRRRSRISVD